MRSFRAILVVFLALLFVYSTNRCVIAATFPGEVEKCCESERAPGDSERGLPCSGSDCTPCATLETGVNLAALAPLVLPAPVWVEDVDVAELMRRLVAAMAEEVSSTPPDPSAIPSPRWHDVMKKALPVRGPSRVA